MHERNAAVALAVIGHGFLMLAEALDKSGAIAAVDVLGGLVGPDSDPAPATDTPSPAKGSPNKVTPPAPAPATGPRRMTLAKPAKPAPEPDEQEDHTSGDADDAQARLNALSDEDISEMGRPELKTLAEALGLDVQGKKGDDLRDMLRNKRSGGRKPAPAAPPKGGLKLGGKKVGKGADLETQREELRIFFKANKDVIEETYPNFFDEVEDGEEYDADAPKAALILADDDLMQSEWTDNVQEAKASGEWDDMVERAGAEVE